MIVPGVRDEEKFKELTGQMNRVRLIIRVKYGLKVAREWGYIGE